MKWRSWRGNFHIHMWNIRVNTRGHSFVHVSMFSIWNSEHFFSQHKYHNYICLLNLMFFRSRWRKCKDNVFISFVFLENFLQTPLELRFWSLNKKKIYVNFQQSLLSLLVSSLFINFWVSSAVSSNSIISFFELEKPFAKRWLCCWAITQYRVWSSLIRRLVTLHHMRFFQLQNVRLLYLIKSYSLFSISIPILDGLMENVCPILV